MYKIVPVDSLRSEGLEQLGTKRKFWYDNAGRRSLFKAEERGTGEDWAEKIACELASLLGLPHVHYELAVEVSTNTPGVICESCAIGYTGFPLGNQLLLERDPAYPAAHGNRYKVKQHTVDAVATVITGLQPVPAPWNENLPGAANTATDAFAGYLMLDAWIANQDRHHENWGALRQGKTLFLAPSFDHGAALARNLRDTERLDRLRSTDSRRGIPFFATRATSAFYANVDALKPMTTFDVWNVFAKRSEHGAPAWQRRLQAISEPTLRDIIGKVPEHRISSIAREFTLQLLLENQKRILGGVQI